MLRRSTRKRVPSRAREVVAASTVSAVKRAREQNKQNSGVQARGQTPGTAATCTNTVDSEAYQAHAGTEQFSFSQTVANTRSVLQVPFGQPVVSQPVTSTNSEMLTNTCTNSVSSPSLGGCAEAINLNRTEVLILRMVLLKWKEIEAKLDGRCVILI